MISRMKTAFMDGISRQSLFMVCLAALLVLPVSGAALAASDWKPLTERLTADGFSREAIAALFARPEVFFEPDTMAGKLRALIRSRSPDATAITEALRKAYRREYLNPLSIARARAFLIDNRTLLEQITSRYGVPGEIVVAIFLVETHLGKSTGNRRVFNRLASMARITDLDIVRPHLDASLFTPENEAFARRRCREKSDWAYSELKALLLLAAQDGIDPLTFRGSTYGAIGLCQFMPSNVFLYGIDADGDGRIDLFTKPDALHSIANYLRGHGWREDMDRSDRQRVIFAYNHSRVYADTVLEVAEKIQVDGRRDPPVR
ncbi:MAG: lytic murein transglycosylase [Thermodesulfobacteriota bacterium]